MYAARRMMATYSLCEDTCTWVGAACLARIHDGSVRWARGREVRLLSRCSVASALVSASLAVCAEPSFYLAAVLVRGLHFGDLRRISAAALCHGPDGRETHFDLAELALGERRQVVVCGQVNVAKRLDVDGLHPDILGLGHERLDSAVDPVVVVD